MVSPYPLVAGSARPNPKMGAPDAENPLFLGFSVLRGGPRPWSETMVSEGARPWGRGRSGDCELIQKIKASEWFPSQKFSFSSPFFTGRTGELLGSFLVVWPLHNLAM